MLNCDKCITVFSFNGKGYDKSVFEGVSIFGSHGVEIIDSGFKEFNQYKIRIPTEGVLNIKCGDRVVFGNADVLDVENGYTIMKITDNRRGCCKHYLLTIK